MPEAGNQDHEGVKPCTRSARRRHGAERPQTRIRPLKCSLSFDDSLELRWLPAAGRANLSGEVKGRTVFVYDAAYGAAFSTMKHELIAYEGLPNSLL